MDTVLLYDPPPSQVLMAKSKRLLGSPSKCLSLPHPQGVELRPGPEQRFRHVGWVPYWAHKQRHWALKCTLPELRSLEQWRAGTNPHKDMVGVGGWKPLPSPGRLRNSQLRPVLGSEKCLEKGGKPGLVATHLQSQLLWGLSQV